MFCQGLVAAAEYYDPLATAHVNSTTNVQYKLRLQPDQLLRAAYEYGKVEGAAQDLQHLGVDLPVRDGDPAQNCPACSLTARTHLNDGAHFHEYGMPAAHHLSMCMGHEDCSLHL